MEIKPPLAVIVGPTASGKSELAIELAEEFHGEIVSADSRQVYRGMDIGTGKVLPEQRQRVPHHLLDMADPTETYTVAQFQHAAMTAVEHIQHRGRLPFLVGGTGLYIKAIVDNLQIPPVAPQAELRAELEMLPLEALRKRLVAADPIGAENIDSQNPRRLIRAIEVSETAGQPWSELQQRGEPLFDAFMIGIEKPAEVLKERILGRSNERLGRGMLDEVKALQQNGVSWEQLESFGLEYRRLAEHLQGKLTFEQAKEKLRRDLLRFAKRQMTWFKGDKRITWVTSEDEAEEVVSDWLLARATVRARRA